MYIKDADPSPDRENGGFCTCGNHGNIMKKARMSDSTQTIGCNCMLIAIILHYHDLKPQNHSRAPCDEIDNKIHTRKLAKQLKTENCEATNSAHSKMRITISYIGNVRKGNTLIEE